MATPLAEPETHTTIKRLLNCSSFGNLADNTERTFVPENPAAITPHPIPVS